MSDAWYRDPPNLPPFEDGLGRLWTFDGRCLSPAPDPGPDWLAEWPEDLRSEAFRAAVCMEFADEYRRHLAEGMPDWP